jgi:hypothetical protein
MADGEALTNERRTAVNVDRRSTKPLEKFALVPHRAGRLTFTQGRERSWWSGTHSQPDE